MVESPKSKQKSGPPGTRRALVSLAERIRPRARGLAARADERAVSSYSPEGACSYMWTRRTGFKPAENPTPPIPHSEPELSLAPTRKRDIQRAPLIRSTTSG